MQRRAWLPAVQPAPIFKGGHVGQFGGGNIRRDTNDIIITVAKGNEQ